MNTFLNYLLEVSIGMTLFYGIYHLMLRKETNFHFVRLYLLLTLFGSLLFPFVNINPGGGVSLLPSIGDAIPTYWLPELIVGGEAVQNELTLSTWQIAALIYAIGIFLLFIRLVIQLNNLMKYLKKTTLSSLDKAHVLEVNDDRPAFSFFNYIIIGQAHLLSEDEKQRIVAHESIHVKRYHSLDMLFVNMMSILFWFNPIIYLYKKALVQVHEFEADSRAVTNHDVDQYCGLLAKVALHSAEFPIANHFNSSLTLKRIAMLKNTKYAMANWKKALLLPLVMLVVLLIACEDQIMSDFQTVTDQSTVVTNYPAEVEKTVNDIKTKNPKAEVLIVGVMNDNPNALENLEKSVKANEIRAIHVIKPTDNKKHDFDSYVVIEKGGTLNQVASMTQNGDVFTVVEETAQPAGGMTALYELIGTNLKYPADARQKGIEGKVFVQFIVNENGALSDFMVLKGIGSGCDEEAMRALRLSPNWIPGKQRGVAVKQRMVLPITFKLGNGNETGSIREFETTSDQSFAIQKAYFKMQINTSVKTEGNAKTITGTILNEQGEPLEGANVVVTNDTQGIVVGRDGKFTITPNRATGSLTVSYIGFQTERISF